MNPFIITVSLFSSIFLAAGDIIMPPIGIHYGCCEDVLTLPPLPYADTGTVLPPIPSVDGVLTPPLPHCGGVGVITPPIPSAAGGGTVVPPIPGAVFLRRALIILASDDDGNVLAATADEYWIPGEGDIWVIRCHPRWFPMSIFSHSVVRPWFHADEMD